MKLVIVAVLLALTGCTVKAELSILKQWDRPGERIVVETQKEETSVGK